MKRLIKIDKHDLINSPTVKEMVEFADISKVLMLNFIASNHSYEQTLQLYNNYKNKCNDIKSSNFLKAIIMESLCRIGTEGAFDKQKELLIDDNHDDTYPRYFSIHLFTALKLNKYDYIIENTKTVDIKYPTQNNIRMIAKVKSSDINDALNELKKFVEHKVDLKKNKPFIFNDTVSYYFLIFNKILTLIINE
jgi:uncharacterized membrane-anchored protein YjiN (DUF445 family)